MSCICICCIAIHFFKETRQCIINLRLCNGTSHDRVPYSCPARPEHQRLRSLFLHKLFNGLVKNKVVLNNSYDKLKKCVMMFRSFSREPKFFGRFERQDLLISSRMFIAIFFWINKHIFYSGYSLCADEVNFAVFVFFHCTFVFCFICMLPWLENRGNNRKCKSQWILWF